MAKKKTFKKQETDEEDLAKFKEHIKMINEKTKKIVNKYRTWWDKEKRTWKEGFKGHGHS